MNPISHKQARAYIQSQFDGLLEGINLPALQDHLMECGTCRAYARRMEVLDAELKQSYPERISHPSTLSRPFFADDASFTLHQKMRSKMKSRQVLSAAAAIPLVVIMVVAAIGFSWVLSTRGKVLMPGAGGRPVPTVTPTPLPWTEEHPLTSVEQIETVLNELAQKNVEASEGSAWVHTTSEDLFQPGLMRSSHIESWLHYPKDGQDCIESLTLVREKPESDTYLQVLVGLSDGRTGDLVQLRDGAGQVSSNKPGFSGCSLTPVLTSAGQLAVRLGEEQAGLQGKPMEVKAWYAALNDRVVFTVSATFTLPSKAQAADRMKETRSFDVETGATVREGVRWEWEDGSVFGESAQGYKTEYLDSLPADIAAQFTQLSSELRGYADGTIARPTQTGIVDTSPVPVVDDEQFIPETDPLTDGQTILRILHALKQRQIERLSEPGWYVYGPDTPDPDDWMSNRYLLTHTIDQEGQCDYMSYYVKDGAMLPQEIVLSDGRWGLVSVVENGEISMGETGKINWSNGPMTDTCRVKNTETVSFIQNEADYFKDLVDGKMQGTYKAWTQGMGDRKVFVLNYEITGIGMGNVMDPDTRQLEPIERMQTWVYFDLDWGTVLSEAGERVFFLQSGKVLGSAPAPDKALHVGYTYYPELPADLKEVFETTVAKLEAHLQK